MKDDERQVLILIRMLSEILDDDINFTILYHSVDIPIKRLKYIIEKHYKFNHIECYSSLNNFWLTKVGKDFIDREVI